MSLGKLELFAVSEQYWVSSFDPGWYRTVLYPPSR